MSFFVTVTFDLKQADPSVYKKISNDLKKIDFSKVISGKKEIPVTLPANTFVAKFENDDYDRSSEICDFIGSEIRIIFKRHKVFGKYFVVAGRNWAWKKSTIG